MSELQICSSKDISEINLSMDDKSSISIYQKAYGVHTPLNRLSCLFPTGCLKAQAATFFSPSLPKEKMEAIAKLGFGNIGKVFLQYEEAFWENDVSHINFIWDDDSVTSVCTNQTQWLKHLQLFTVMRPKEKYDKQLIMTVLNVQICYKTGFVF